jgi:hypothetical protein
VYVNGTMLTGLTRYTSSYDKTTNTSASVILGGGSDSLKGYIGKSKLWNRVITIDEISAL